MSLKVFEWNDLANNSSNPFKESAIAIGVFDGIHLGHRELIKKVVLRGPNPAIVTFRENPKKYLSPDAYMGDLFSLKQKLTAFEQFGVNSVVLIDFSLNFSKISGKDFMDLLAERCRMVFLAIGSNFHCGYQKDTGAETIKEINERKGIQTKIIRELSLEPGKIPVSSSRLREAVYQGDLETAALLTGRNFELDLEGIKADCFKKGNDDWLAFDFNFVKRIIPAEGSYCVLLQPGSREGIINIEKGKVFITEGLATSKWSGGLNFKAKISSLEFIKKVPN